VQYRDAAGNKVKNNQGYSAIRLAWDDRGRLTGREFLDEKGTGTKNAEGVSEEKYVYDADGRITDIVRIND
jgi:YD repeat-containing protein